MNPVFVFIVVLIAALLWVLLAFSFKIVGALAKHLADDVKYAIKEEEKKDNGDN